MRKNKVSSNVDLARLEYSIDELIRVCERLQEENARLRNESLGLKSEQRELVKKNQSSTSKMEAIITRLKTMELEI